MSSRPPDHLSRTGDPVSPITSVHLLRNWWFYWSLTGSSVEEMFSLVLYLQRKQEVVALLYVNVSVGL